MNRRNPPVVFKECAGSQRGFGLVEIMIAMTLGVIIILTVSTLFSDTSRTLFEVNRSGRQLENSMFTLDLLAGELALAGYWGEAGYPIVADTQIFLTDEDIETAPSTLSWTPGSTVPPICLGTGASISGSADDNKAELAYAMEFPVYSASGATLNSEFTANTCDGSGATARAGSEFFVVRRAGTCATGAGSLATSNNCAALGDFYHLQTNGCYSENAGLAGGEIKLYQVTDATVGTLLPFTAYDCATASPIYRYMNRIYYVDGSDILTRLTLDNVGGTIRFVPEQLVQGVELLRFEWLIDSSGDGEYDSVSRAPTVTEWQNIVGVKIWLVSRATTEEPGFTDDFTYTIAGDSWTVPSGNEGYRRRVQSRTVDFPNIGGRRR
jgi:type IV pilus assembly protein PilW